MIKLPKLSDYGVVLMTHFAALPPRTVHAARELSERSGLPLPTVSKVLKALSRAGLLEATRGYRGGYALGRAPEDVTVAEIIAAVEGEVPLTACSDPSAAESHQCRTGDRCPMRGRWRPVREAMQRALESVSIADLTEAPVVTIETKHQGAA